RHTRFSRDWSSDVCSSDLSAAMRFVEDKEWIPSFDIRYHLGVDGLSIALILLTTLTSVLVLVGAWGSVERRAHQYFASFLLLERSEERRVGREWGAQRAEH